MKSNTFIVLHALLAVLVLGGCLTMADNNRENDRAAIDRLTKEMIEAFDRRDASAIAKHWTDEGEFTHNSDDPVRGRAEIQKGYEEFFKTLNGKPRLEIQSDSLRFLSSDMAVKQTTLRLKSEEGEIASGRQDTVLVREAGQWKIAIVREWDRDISLDTSLKELEWLIGSWRAATPEREVTVTYEWDKNQAFIRGSFTVKEGATVVESGMEMIGKDNASGLIRSWVFQSDGGFGSGVWSRDGNKWSIDARGVKGDGSELTGTVVYIRVDPNTFTWQTIDLAIDGKDAADTPPIKVVKQPPAK